MLEARAEKPCAVDPLGSIPQEMLRLDNVTIEYNHEKRHIQATRNVSFEVMSSDRFILLGASGCGKSSLLKAIGGHIRPKCGTISLKGNAITRPGPERMMVFQEFDQLLPWKTVLQNVAFPIEKATSLSKRAAKDRAMAYVEKVGLSKFAHQFPHTLSGGMKQRVAIARGMAMEPDVLLMDEPFAALDALTRVQMQDELLQLWDDTRVTLVFVTHSIKEAIRLGNRILLLSPHPGEVLAELNNPPNAVLHEGWEQAFEQKIHSMLFPNPLERAHRHERS